VSRILIVDDEKNIRRELQGLLVDEGYRASVAPDAESALAMLAEEAPDLVLLDVMLPGLDGLAALERLRASGEDVAVVLMSGQASIESAVKATKLGAFDYLEKPLDPARLLLTVRNALETSRLRRRNRELAPPRAESALVGSSEAMRRLRGDILRAAAAEARVLVTGENGTGKELVARALHEGSRRVSGPFVKVNCAAIPRDLIESELFGHEKGAFTGASAKRIGKVEQADGGTLLLDEVGDMALDAQAKLLRVLEESEVERVGGNEAIRVDVRVIAATNQDLPARIAKGAFREDLFYRLNVVPIAVPPLRERRDDVPELVQHFRRRFQEDAGKPMRPIDDAALAALTAWSWPGNVRELRNVVERLEIMTEGDRLRAADVERVLRGAREAPASSSGGEEAAVPLEDRTLREILEGTERHAIERALAEAGGTVSEAARRLGLDRANLHRKMRRLGMARPGGGDEGGEADDEESVSG
jgi:two-component system nitrogen regulation response regulator NtrX